MKQLSPSAFVRIPCFDLMVFAEKSYIIAHSHIPVYSSVVIIYTCKYTDYTYNKSLVSMLFIFPVCVPISSTGSWDLFAIKSAAVFGLVFF